MKQGTTVYLKPSPMQPDTFSKYGYADAANLRALRRGYGHDIYPQYPTTYNMPRVVEYAGNYCGEGLGAFTHKGFTVDYYAAPRSLDFDDKNLKKLYEGLRNFDIEWQKNLNGIAKNLDGLLGFIEFVSAGSLKKEDVRKAFIGPFPSSGVALFLEVAAGKRPLDQGFRDIAKVQSRHLAAAAAQLGLVGGVGALLSSGAVATAAATAGVAAPVAAVAGALVPVAAVAVPAAAACGAVAAGLSLLSGGKTPSKAEFSKSVKDAAALTGQQVPSDEKINLMYAGLTAATKKPDSGKKTASQPTVRKTKRLSEPADQQPSLPSEPPAFSPPKVTAKSSTAILVGVAALAAVLIATK